MSNDANVNWMFQTHLHPSASVLSKFIQSKLTVHSNINNHWFDHVYTVDSHVDNSIARDFI